MQTPMPPDAAKEIEYVKSMVARHFPVYDVKVNYDVVEFYCRVDETMLEESFTRLREEMSPQGYIPMITYQKGEHVVIVGKKPRSRYRSVYVNLGMLIITFAAVTFAGMFFWAGYANVPSDEFYSLATIGAAIVVFTLPLLAILGAHELGHYLIARRRKVAASLPFFIPFIPPLGTAGAVISLRDPIPDRKSLLEIGIAGPVAGLFMTILIGILGLILTNAEARMVPDDFGSEGAYIFYLPLFHQFLQMLVPVTGDYLTHPMTFAAWAGFFVTAINLLPAGPLDGGHIARALLGKNARYASWATVALLVGLFLFFWFGWIVFAIFILLVGTRHPPPLNDITRLDPWRMLAGVSAFAILIVSFVPIPVTIVIPDHSIELSPFDGANATVAPGDISYFTFEVENTGNVMSNITVLAEDVPVGWAVGFRFNTSANASFEETVDRRFDDSEIQTYDMRVLCGPSAPGEHQLMVVARSQSAPEDEPAEATITYTFLLESPDVQFWAADDISIAPGESEAVRVQINNTEDADISLTITAADLPTIGVDFYVDELGTNHTQTLNITVPANESASFYVFVFTSESTPEGERIVSVIISYYESDLGTIDVYVTVL